MFHFLRCLFCLACLISYGELSPHEFSVSCHEANHEIIASRAELLHVFCNYHKATTNRDQLKVDFAAIPVQKLSSRGVYTATFRFLAVICPDFSLVGPSSSGRGGRGRKERPLPQSIDEMPVYEESKTKDFSDGNIYAGLVESDGADEHNED